MRRPRLSIALVGLLAGGLCATAGLWIRMPVPEVHDEFSYLLAGDTYAHGRLTNPTHPLWQHFESFHIIHQPTYMSMYPPGQGLFLGLGQVLTGRPIVGVWLSTALAVAAVCWMLQGWVPARWALCGGLLMAVHPTVFRWGQSYWGGAVAMLGGALVLGALRRLARHWRVCDALWLGAGMGVLALSRPYEGAVLSALCVMTLWLWHRHDRRLSGLEFLRRVLMPAAGVVAATMCWFACDNWRVTGNPLRLPYQEERSQYAPVRNSLLGLSAKRTNVYRHPVMQEFYEGWEMEQYTLFTANLAEVISDKIATYSRGYFGLSVAPPLTGLVLVLLLGMRGLVRRRWMKIGLGIWLAFSVAQLPVTWAHFHYAALLHYAAPAYGFAALWVVESTRQLRLWRWQG